MPPLFGRLLDSSTRAFAAFAEFTTTLASSPVTAMEYCFMASPNGTSFSPNISRSFSPVKNATRPPLFGTVFASSIRALPAVTELTTTSAFSPVTAIENSFIASPNGTSCSPKASMSFSPAKKPTTPPLFGIVDAISAIAFPAFAASVTTLASKPATESAKAFIASPKGTSWSPNAPISFSPAKKPTTPPLLGSVAAISASVLPATAALATTSPSIPDISSENCFIAVPKGTSSSANPVSEDPPVNQEVSPSRIFAAVRIRIVSARAFTPSIIDGSIAEAP